MKKRMWMRPSTERHLAVLQSMGVTVVPPVSKVLACGYVGLGGLAAVMYVLQCKLARVSCRVLHCCTSVRSNCANNTEQKGAAMPISHALGGNKLNSYIPAITVSYTPLRAIEPWQFG
eukprot:9804-Heterococcus_DN1.PRE.4